MDVDQVSIFLALLSFLALGTGVGTLGLLATGRIERLRPVLDLLLPLAFVIALTSMLGSLYYSGIQHYRPCRLCWWQRIMMYPLVPVLGAALLRRDRLAALYGLPLAVIGLGFSIYHKRLQWFPGESDSCDAEAPCSLVWVDTFDFVSIPFMAGTGFLAIIGLLGAHLMLHRAAPTEVSQPIDDSVELTR